MMVPGGFGWSLGLATGIFRGVPEFLYHAEPDMPFYLAYFLTGWWLYSLHGGLAFPRWQTSAHQPGSRSGSSRGRGRAFQFVRKCAATCRITT